MSQKKILPVLLLAVFALALILSIKFLGPGSTPVTTPSIVPEEPLAEQDQGTSVDVETPEAKPVVNNAQTGPENPVQTVAVQLSQSLQDVKDGKTSIMTSILSGEDLNVQLTELLALSEAGEAWADYAIGQLAEMCTYLHETPETQLIEMFTATRRGISEEQQTQFSELMPVVLDASKRCKTMDGGQLSALGNPRDWLERAAQKNQPSAFVSNGFAMISKRLRQESKREQDKLYADGGVLEGDTEEARELRDAIRNQAKSEYLKQVREHFSAGRMNPEALMSMAEHLNLFYEGDHPLKSKEAWMLLACDKGFEKGCERGSKTMGMFCMFDPACQTGGNFQEGIVWQQGQFKYDEYRRTADELKRIFENRDWDRLGF